MMRLERWFNKSSSWLRLLLHRREADQALEEEIQFWAKSMAASLVHDLPAKSPVSIVFGGAVMIVLGLVAAYIPARRAMGFDPMVALRCE